MARVRRRVASDGFFFTTRRALMLADERAQI
jgi:hypothetical protein